ncbi:MAG TPA: hypothetical protein VKP67_16025 [Xanthobacteraceae bacterium]|nr:hypothetical protein [Xanthobacteraceae bacterium]
MTRTFGSERAATWGSNSGLSILDSYKDQGLGLDRAKCLRGVAIKARCRADFVRSYAQGLVDPVVGVERPYYGISLLGHSRQDVHAVLALRLLNVGVRRADASWYSLAV